MTVGKMYSAKTPSVVPVLNLPYDTGDVSFTSVPSEKLTNGFSLIVQRSPPISIEYAHSDGASVSVIFPP